MAHVLILYATQEGQTRSIAEFIGDILKDEGHTAEVDSVDTPKTLGSFDAVMIGASIHIGHYPQSLRDFIKKHIKRLNAMPSAFFSVCLTASKTDEEHRALAQNYLDGLFNESDWKPDLSTSFAGALKFTQYGFFKTQLMKAIAKREHLQVDSKHDYSYTSWEKVMRFAMKFVQLLKKPAAPSQAEAKLNASL
ncbi:MAG: menaquinone-dependent protoporphyrinogen IX dehydrogenase [Trueperaceae bacterium]|nr:menaquinone-dependent protoporphyrinogen IX dehydrogenase [Trueperaceae bacterium]